MWLWGTMRVVYQWAILKGKGGQRHAPCHIKSCKCHLICDGPGAIEQVALDVDQIVLIHCQMRKVDALLCSFLP